MKGVCISNGELDDVFEIVIPFSQATRRGFQPCDLLAREYQDGDPNGTYCSLRIC